MALLQRAILAKFKWIFNPNIPPEDDVSAEPYFFVQSFYI